jgi:GT2 family glycosyltransferase
LKSLLYRLAYAIPKRWRKVFSSNSIIKLCYNFIIAGYSPTASYKKLLKQQKKLLVKKYEKFDSVNHKKIIIVIELSLGYEHILRDSLDSLDLLKDEIDSIYFLHDYNCKEDNDLRERTLDTVLANPTFAYTTDSKENFLSNISNVNSEVFIWCQRPSIFYPSSLRALLQSYNANETRPTAIYSDHDMLCNGERTTPSFKPSLNIDWLLCSNYMGKVILFNKAKLVDKVERSDFTLFGDKSDLLHDLLKAVATDSSCLVKHVPFVLYSEIHDELDKITNTPVKRIYWPLPANLPLVSIIIPTRNGKQLVQQCIESIYQFTDYNRLEIILVNNASDDVESIEYFQSLAKNNKVQLVSYDEPFNYSAINNFAVQYAKGEVLLFMNNDIELLHKNWLEEMVVQAMREDIGCVGAKLYYPNMTVQHAGVIVGLWGCAGHSHKHFEYTDDGYMNRLNVVQNYTAVTAACMAVRKTVFNEVDGFNEKDLTVAFNDVDLCLKIQAKGYRNLWTPYAEMIHHESSSRGAEDTPEKKAREAKEIAYMQSTWHLDTEVDKAYSPWLTQEKEDFSFIIEKR